MLGGLFGNGDDHIISFFSFSKYNPHLKRVDYSGVAPSSVDPIIEKINDNVIFIISGEMTERRVKLYLIKENEFVGIYKNITSPFYGGIGSTLTKHN